MPFSEVYRQQVDLLIRMIPIIAEEECFALKGGTAINLFIRDMPRLSVDIDLTYLPVGPREESLAAVDAAMKRIAVQIQKRLPGAQITESRLAQEGVITKVIVLAKGVQIKIEVTPVLRGCVYEPETRTVSPKVEDSFGFAETKIVSHADLYAGKCVAALDRQHPRDLFDVRDLLNNEGLSDELRKAFIVYMLSHNRPMFEVLTVRPMDLEQEYARGFEGMTEEAVPLEELLAAREALKDQLVTGMPQDHRDFMISFERGEPDWSLLGLDGVEELPAVLWRQRNLNQLDGSKRAKLVQNLENVLS